MHYVVAIDGPSSSGKSSVARAVALQTGFTYIDTGAQYRAIGLYASRSGVKDTTNAREVVKLLPEIELSLIIKDGTQRVILNGEDVSEDIRLPEMSMHASNVSQILEVREFLFDMQKSYAEISNIIMDGRDIGTVIFPNADVKIFLTASSEVRAKRRYKELLAKGQQVEYDALLKEIEQRDYNDSNRAVRPLKKAEDAILIDTSDMTLDDVTEKIKGIMQSKIKL